ncbi:hypothetical protein DFJ73DRAFT_960836 [Zopfochytrium polystomum]|nr:hypothetical protein DFJ73DRAFT_960836 [Zopfochytrium polystomum]
MSARLFWRRGGNRFPHSFVRSHRHRIAFAGAAKGRANLQGESTRSFSSSHGSSRLQVAMTSSMDQLPAADAAGAAFLATFDSVKYDFGNTLLWVEHNKGDSISDGAVIHAIFPPTAAAATSTTTTDGSALQPPAPPPPPPTEIAVFIKTFRDSEYSRWTGDAWQAELGYQCPTYSLAPRPADLSSLGWCWRGTADQLYAVATDLVPDPPSPEDTAANSDVSVERLLERRKAFADLTGHLESDEFPLLKMFRLWYEEGRTRDWTKLPKYRAYT